jgi:hypothetical protein
MFRITFKNHTWSSIKTGPLGSTCIWNQSEKLILADHQFALSPQTQKKKKKKKSKAGLLHAMVVLGGRGGLAPTHS